VVAALIPASLWPGARAAAILGAAAVVFAAGFATAWNWQSNKLDAEIERGKSALAAIRAEYAAAETAAKTAADALRDQDQAKAGEVEREYQATIDRLRRERGGPGPVVRVQCPPAGAVSTAGNRPASDPGSPAGAATDRSGVAGDGATGYRDLDASGIRALTTEAMLVSERLRSLQERCRS
jgi:hypothetical protein